MKIFKMLTKELNEKAELYLLSIYNKLMKLKYEDRFVTVVGLGLRDNQFYMRGQVDTSFSKTRGVYRARDILKENIFMTKGPMPGFKPHRAVLVPFPSLILAGPKIIDEVAREWSGCTLSYNIPFIEYTIAK
jgi:hypothetical protein